MADEPATAAATAAIGAGTTASAATTGAAGDGEAADWRAWTYSDLSIVDYADLSCVVLLRFISLQLPPAAPPKPPQPVAAATAAATAAAAAASSSFAALHGTACELLGSFLASIQPAARAREIGCLLSHDLVARLHAAVHAADYAAQVIN